ncbi:DUF4139 domain-containing protein [Marinobacter litoralis]|uniref:DUF4139 domain-containing protein n=1 Tax=Marinobacter litoralis TaxID=187981 RepID=UPI0018EDB7A5|nr:DUF4139 domain-containing protein [Marinobacter litoralis]MBJ6138970.1 DUF4139 domain-containing protein [Marinobacter litoralis]
MNKPGLLALAMSISTLPMTALASITAATLYPSHAELTWNETEQIRAGTGTIEIKGLPLSLQDQSLQVMLDGMPDATLQQVQITRAEREEFVAEETRRIRKELSEVTLRIQEQKDLISAWEQQVKLMDHAAQSPHELTASELSDLAIALKDTTLAALKEIRQTRVSMQDDIALKDRLTRELAQTTQRAKATKNVTIHYQAPESGAVQVELRFQTSEASWRSEYNARLNTEADSGGALTLEHMAVVHQTTGSDWNDVQLQLATANARRGTSMPNVYPWIVSPGKERYQAKMRAPVAEMQAGSAMADSVTVERASTFTQSYRLAGKVQVPSGASGHRFKVADHVLPVEVAVWAAPVLDQTGYIHAKGEFNGNVPIPAGLATLYRDGQSVGQTHIGELADGETVDLGFGVDQAVRIKVVNELERTGEEGIWKSENVQRRQNRFDITNHHDKPVQVRIFDRLPVSEQDVLTVKPLEISEPVQRDYDDKKGVLVWDREIAAGETKSVKSGFEVRVPEGTSLPPL